MEESLEDKLKSLGVHLGAEHLKPPTSKKTTYPIETVLDGFDDVTPFGNTFIVQQDFSEDYQHGSVRICEDGDIKILAELCRYEQLHQKDRSRFLFLDTETSGLAGGTGTFVFMIGLGFRTQNGFRLIQLFMRDPAFEPALLATLTKIVEPFDVIVSFNGKGFDIPILNTRHILNRIPTPFDGIDHIDMLPVARKLWRNRLPSRALKSLETDVLSILRSQEEVPGWMIPELYFDYLKNGDARPLAGVFYHNGIDILSLAAVFNLVGNMLANPNPEQVPYGLDLIAIARMYEDLEYYDVAIQLYEKGLEQDLPLPFFIQTLQRFALLYRKQGKWEHAILLWQKAMQYNQFEAGIELAKYFEHHARDYSRAMIWARESQQCIQRSNLHKYQKSSFLNDIERRISRLQAKIDKVTGSDSHHS